MDSFEWEQLFLFYVLTARLVFLFQTDLEQNGCGHYVHTKLQFIKLPSLQSLINWKQKIISFFGLSSHKVCSLLFQHWLLLKFNAWKEPLWPKKISKIFAIVVISKENHNESSSTLLFFVLDGVGCSTQVYPHQTDYVMFTFPNTWAMPRFEPMPSCIIPNKLLSHYDL